MVSKVCFNSDAGDLVLNVASGRGPGPYMAGCCKGCQPLSTVRRRRAGGRVGGGGRLCAFVGWLLVERRARVNPVFGVPGAKGGERFG
jgi:hypothetical protein